MLNERLKNHIGYSGEALNILLTMPEDRQERLADKFDEFNEDIYKRIDREILKHPEKTPNQVMKEWLSVKDAPHTPKQIKYILGEYKKRRLKKRKKNRN